MRQRITTGAIMEKDIDDLIDQLSLQQLKKLVGKYARLDRQLRDEILSTAPVRNASFNGLMLEECRRRVEEAIVRDLKGELDDYYNQKIVNWDSAVATLAKAVKDYKYEINQMMLSHYWMRQKYESQKSRNVSLSKMSMAPISMLSMRTCPRKLIS